MSTTPCCPLWMNDPTVLLTNWHEIVPESAMSKARKTNAMTRLLLLLGIAALVHVMRVGSKGDASVVYAALAVMLVFVITMCIMIRKNNASDDTAMQAGAQEPVDALPDKLYNSNQRAFERTMTDDVTVDTTQSDVSWIVGDAGQRRDYAPM